MKNFISIVLGTFFCCTVLAAPTPPTVRAEIDTLLLRLQNSGCEFNRNGSWHAGAEAKTHLLRKLAYIEDRSTVQSTEQFIELAASKSSSSGKAYQVRCGGRPPEASRDWLLRELTGMRKPETKGKP